MNINPNTIPLHEARFYIKEYVNSAKQYMFTSANFRYYIEQRTGKRINSSQLANALSQLVDIKFLKRIGVGIYSRVDG